MGKRARKQRLKGQRNHRKVKVVGLPAYELVERIRSILEEELMHKEKRYQKTPTGGLKWNIKRYESALVALEELERRVARKL